MSIVEKSIEKLKTSQPDSEVSPRVEPALDATAADAAPTVERLQERTHAGNRTVEPAPLWHVDQMELKRMGLLPLDDREGGRLADELRRIKQPLLDNVAGKGRKPLVHAERIMVTSAVPREGKSFTSVNLALSLAQERDFEVLLVDGDIPKSDITRIFKLEGRPGLMDVLADERCQPADVIVRTDVRNLLVVPVGERHPLTTELFGSHRMEYVLEEFAGRDRRRVVVFDSSPLLATSETQVLASHMGQIVMVVAEGRTSRQEVRTALQRLSGAQYIGLILNMNRLSVSESRYSGDYFQYFSPRLGEA
ncbi:MAG: AAA family ATPase [Rhodanobacter sp.]